MSRANYGTNIRGVNQQLGREVKRAMAKAGMTVPGLVTRTGLGDSWLKQLRTGRIDKPNPAWLVKVAEELGADPHEWLALSNQLGRAAAVTPPTDSRALITALAEQNATLVEQVSLLLEELRLGRAAQTASTDALLDAMAAVVGGRDRSETSGGSEPEVPAGTGR